MDQALPSLPYTTPINSRPTTILFFVSVPCVVAGIWWLSRNAFEGWVTIIVFTPLAVLSSIGMMPDSGYLRLDEDGFTFCSMFRKKTIPWSAVSGFLLVRYGRKPMLGWTYTPEYIEARRPRRLGSWFGGADAALSDIYETPANQLVPLMNRILQSRHP